jgi:uncharacterized membrane protein
MTMIGFIIGAAVAIGLSRVVRCGARGRRMRGGGRRWRGRRRRWGWRGPWLERAVAELGLSGEQEREVRGAFKELRGRARELRRERDAPRADLAAALRADSFDEELFGAMFVRHDDTLRQARVAGVDFFAIVHQALDPEQRDRLAELVGGRRGFGGPYRDGGREQL